MTRRHQLLDEVADDVLDAEVQLLRAIGASRRDDDGVIGERAQLAAVSRAETPAPRTLARAPPRPRAARSASCRSSSG